MNEVTKTLIFVAIAAVVCTAAAIPQWLAPDEVQLDQWVNKPLFPEFTDPLAAKSLEIVKVDEFGQPQSFEVSQVNDLWVIPSHGNYPADAANQMRDVAASLLDLKILEARKLETQRAVQRSEPADEDQGDDNNSESNDDDQEADSEKTEQDQPTSFAEYGVLEPTSANASEGNEAVGTLISIEDFKGNSLLELIVGKPVKGRPELRWVRIPGQDVVYVTEINLDNLSTRFQDWIEKDLLQIAGFDIATVTLKDYSVLRRGADLSGRLLLAIDNRFHMTLNAENGWELTEFTLFDPEDKPYEASLLPNEELNTAKLGELKTALDNLEIVDVLRKPKGLSANLEASEEFMNNTENQLSLITTGFYPIPGPSGRAVLYSSHGDVEVTTKEGVQYILRFGEVQGAEQGEEGGKLNRYLMVTARVNEEQFPEPQYQELPPLPAEPAGPPPAADEVTPDNKIDPVKAERERIQKENDRKREAWQEKRKKAADKAREMNARFAEWYYVISEDTYQKIHLSRSDVIQEAQQQDGSAPGFEVDAFRELEEQGIEGTATP